MNDTHINRESAIRLFENNGFDYDEQKNELVYEDDKGTKFAFLAVWLKSDPTAEYDLASVRQLLQIHLASVKKMDTIKQGLIDYGMEYDADNDKDKPEGEKEYKFYYKDKETGTYLFGTTLDYLVALLAAKPDETVKSLLDAMKKDAIETAKDTQNGKKTQEQL